MTHEQPIPVPSLVQENAWVHRLARRLVRDEHLAADVAQDTLVVGLGGSAPDDPDVTPRGWLAGIARRLALQAVRRRREREIRELIAVRGATDDVEARAAERLRVHEVLARAVRELPEPYRTAVTLRFFEGLSPAAIARTRSHTPEAVRQHVHRGLGMLRQKLDGEFGDRRAWMLALVSLGLDRPRGPALPWPAATLAAIAVVLLALGVVIAIAWGQRQPDAPRPALPSIDVIGDPVWSSAGGGESPRAVPGAQEPAAVAAASDRYLAPLVAGEAFAGSVLLARRGQVLLHKAYGLADRAAAAANTTDTRFKLMSTTKAITAVAVMRLVQAGKLDLEGRVGTYVSPWPEAWRDVTLHDLLDHTSGIPNLELEWTVVERETKQRGAGAWPAMAQRLAAAPREPVAQHYSNFNFELAGIVAETVGGKPLDQLLGEQVFAPAGMGATAIDDGERTASLAIGYFVGATEPQPSEQDMSVIQAAGGLWSTTGDLYRFDRALKDGKLLSADLHARMVAPREASPSYACGWQVTPVHGRTCWHHSGGANGYVADFLRFPDDDACVVVLSNHAFAPISRISADLAAILFGLEHRVPVALSAAQLDACTGVFATADQPAQHLLVRRAGKLLLLFETSSGMERCGGSLLIPVGPGRFLAPFGGGEYSIDPESVRTPYGTAARSPDPAARWRELLGALQLQGAIGGTGRLAEDGGRFTLHTEYSWPKSIELVPLGDDVALTMYMEEFGTLVRRSGRALRWTRNDGSVVVLTPAK